MRILLLNQTFYPDVVSTAQHLTDLAVSLAERGHEVAVVASRRAYDDPARRFGANETWKGVRIVRVPCPGLGKSRRWRRAVDFGSFLIFCGLRLLLLGRFDVILAMTSPPLMPFIASLFARLRGGRLVLWIMDLNPDEAVAAGWLAKDSWVTRLFEKLQLRAYRSADRVVVLDRFMQERLVSKGVSVDKTAVIPPWSHDDVVYFDDAGRESFRGASGLGEKYVVMYSGNHSPCHPLDTILEAARRLSEVSDLVFCFVGGGSEFGRVKRFAEENRLPNVFCLPYQPLHRLRASLSAADLHLVTMGEPFVGVVHPCKIYNILAVGAPFLYVGPPESHIADVVARLGGNGVARMAAHGDVDAVVTHLTEAQARTRTRAAVPAELRAEFAKSRLLPRMIDVLVA